MANLISRRDILKTSSLVAAGSALGFAGVFGLRPLLAADDDVATIVNVAATAETFATTHYYRALTTDTLMASDDIKKYFAAAMYAELVHLQFLQANGGKSLTDKFYFPVGTFKDVPTLGAITAVAETVFVGAYIAATHRFAELGNADLAATAAQVATVEGQHLLFVRQIAGEKLPNNQVLAGAIFQNVSDAVPVVTPLLDGKKPASGPLAVDFETDAYAYPGDDKVMELVKKTIDMSLLDSTVAPFKKM